MMGFAVVCFPLTTGIMVFSLKRLGYDPVGSSAKGKWSVDLNLKSIAVPGMGTGVGRVPVKDAAQVIVSIVKKFENSFETIYLIDRNENMVESFEQYV